MQRPRIKSSHFPFSTLQTEIVDVKGLSLEVTSMGTGTPVFCVHGLIMHDAFIAPLSRFCPDIFTSYKFYSVARLGYATSSDCPTEYDLNKAVAVYFAVMDTLGLVQPHLLAYSFGGNIALQMLIDGADRFASATLSEAYWVDGTSMAENIAAVVAAKALYETSPLLSAMTYQELICGKSFHTYVDFSCDRESVNTHLPRAAATMFDHDFNLLNGWSFPDFIETAPQGSGPDLPVLLALGSDSDTHVPGFRHRHRLLENWFPNHRSFILPQATHGMQISHPKLFGDQSMAFWDGLGA